MSRELSLDSVKGLWDASSVRKYVKWKSVVTVSCTPSLSTSKIQSKRFSEICEKSLKYIETIKVLTNHVFQYLGFLTLKHVFMRELTKVNVLMIINLRVTVFSITANHQTATKMDDRSLKIKIQDILSNTDSIMPLLYKSKCFSIG